MSDAVTALFNGTGGGNGTRAGTLQGLLLNVVTLDKAIVMTLVYATIFLTGIVGNVCTCVVISRNRPMHTATNFYLFSLAISDLLLLILGLPQEMYHAWVPEPYIFGETFCVIRGLAAEMSSNASILTITSFTIERYLAICHPLRSHTMSKLSRAIRLILVVWVVAVLCAVPQTIQFGIVQRHDENGTVVPDSEDCNLKTPLDNAFELSTMFFFVLPMSLITVLYVLIGLRLRNPGFRTPNASTKSGNGFQDSRRSTSSRGGGQQSPGRQRASHHQRLMPTLSSSSGNSRRAVVKMLVAVVVAFFLCWAPFHAQRLMAVYASENPPPLVVRVYEALTYVSGVLYYVSATINPILYHIMSLKFRTAFKDTLGSCCGQRPSRATKSSSLYNFNSTVRSRVVTDNTETTLETLMREEDGEEGFANGGTKRTSPPGHAPPAGRSIRLVDRGGPPAERNCRQGGGGHAAVTVVKSDSISNSSMQMMEDEPVSPMELTNFMAEINERCDPHGEVKEKPPTRENGRNGNGYFISRC